MSHPIHSFRILVLALICLSKIGYGLSNYKIENRGKLEIEKPAFLTLAEDGESLFISSFEGMKKDKVMVIRDLNRSFKQPASMVVELLTDEIIWPNELDAVPSEIFGSGYYAIAGGFLVPGKARGAITIVNEDASEIMPLTKVKSGWFYHQTTFVDMNGDGRLDILTARAKKPLFGGSGQGELIWLEQPQDPRKIPWQETILTSGPDVFFVYEDIDGDGAMEVIASQFFTEKLTLSWLDKGQWVSRVLDDTLGAVFHLSFTDLNGDGRRDLLVTNHVADERAGVYVYEVPEFPKEQNWPRHDLLVGIETRNEGRNQASPGAAFAFKPHESAQRPHILVSGDGSQRVHVLEPISMDVKSWDYQERILLDVGGTVGKMAWGDIDGDGYQDLFVPSYDTNSIYVLSYRPGE